MGFEGAQNTVPADESERENNPRRAEAMAHSGDNWESTAERFRKSSEEELKARGYKEGDKQLYTEKAEESADRNEEYGGVMYDLQRIGNRLPVDAARKIKEILDGTGI